MNPKKGLGKSKGKQPAKKLAAPQVSPSQSSSDEECWPLLQQLQTKIAPFEAKRMVQSAANPNKGALARKVKSHKWAKIKALTENLMSHFAAVESNHQASGTSKRSASNFLMPTPLCHNNEEQQGYEMVEVAGPAAAVEHQQGS